MPIGLRNNIYLAAVDDPLNMEAVEYLRAIHSGEISLVLTTTKAISDYLAMLKQVQRTSQVLSEIHPDGELLSVQQANNALIVDETSAPIAKLVDSLIKDAIPKHASDIHIEPFITDKDGYVKVRYRIDGDLFKASDIPIRSYPEVLARIKVLSSLNVSEKKRPQDGQLSIQYNGNSYYYRVSTIPTQNGLEKCVLRLLDNSMLTKTRRELNILPEDNESIDLLLKKKEGVILMVGPTGCGKTTLQYALLNELKSDKVNIVTAEDPVEYAIEGITQVKVNGNTQLTFADALRSFLRQDPDIILIGEMRDEESAQMGMRAAMTGHLVLSTLHTNDSISAIARLKDLNITPFLISDNLNGVIYQRLIKKLCPHCKVSRYATPLEMEALKIKNQALIFSAKGCPHCNYSGYYGRMGIQEIFVNTPEIREMIVSGRSHDEIQDECVNKHGMRLLVDSCRKAVLDGNTDIKELYKYL